VDNTMRAFLHTTTALTLIASSAVATAAEVRVLTVGSTQVAAKAIAADFEMQTRNQVTFTFRPPFDIDKELAEKTFDAIILSVPAMDIHDKAGTLAPTSRVAVARVGVGVVVKEGARPFPTSRRPRS
jgi:molybdate transport system substrate-binding protein